MPSSTVRGDDHSESSSWHKDESKLHPMPALADVDSYDCSSNKILPHESRV